MHESIMLCGGSLNNLKMKCSASKYRLLLYKVKLSTLQGGLLTMKQKAGLHIQKMSHSSGAAAAGIFLGSW